jgi:hypothetical protein
VDGGLKSGPVQGRLLPLGLVVVSPFHNANRKRHVKPRSDWGHSRTLAHGTISCAVSRYRLAMVDRDRVQSNDLLLPNEASKFRAFLMCTLTASMMTILYAGFPLLRLNFLLPLGVWDGWILLIVFVALTLTLFSWSAFETRSLRRLAREL